MKTLIWTINGEIKTATEWCEEYKISRRTVMSRVKKKGMSLEEALTTPPMRSGRASKQVEINGEAKREVEWCKIYGIGYETYRYRVDKIGMTPYEALTTEKLTSGRPKKGSKPDEQTKQFSMFCD